MEVAAAEEAEAAAEEAEAAAEEAEAAAEEAEAAKEADLAAEAARLLTCRIQKYIQMYKDLKYLLLLIAIQKL